MSVPINLDAYFNVDALTEAYLRYKDSKTDRYEHNIVRIRTGADGITWQEFERGLQPRVEAISRLVLGGKYRFFPMREVDIEKPNGGVRTLSVGSIRDVLVQRKLYEALYASAESMFARPGLDMVSFAYRRGKSISLAAQRIWQSIQDGYHYAYEADIRSFFDTLSHARLMSLIDAWLGPDAIARTLLWRYIRTHRVPHDSYPHGAGLEKYFMTNKPTRMRRVAGVPQGGVLSGLLANLYLHELDRWVVDDLGSLLDMRYYRYADDFVILTRDIETSEALHRPVSMKLGEDLQLEIHPPSEKTGVRDLAGEGLNFIGFHFNMRDVRVRTETVQRFKERFMRSLAGEPDLKGRSNHWTKRLKLTIRWCVNPKIIGPAPRRCQDCGLPMEPPRSWIANFAPAVTDVGQLKELDRWMRERVYKHFRDRYRVRVSRTYLRNLGMRSLVGEYYRLRTGSPELCSCDETSEAAPMPESGVLCDELDAEGVQ